MTTQATNDVLRICTYNCEGIKNSEKYISTLKDYDIICVQETWVQEHEVNQLSSINSGYMAVSVSGIDNTNILQGRPYGGVCIMYRNELSSRCESVKLDTRRACSVKLSVNDNFKLLIVCVYMPCDPQLVNKVNVEYEEVLNCVEGLIQSTDCNGIILCGD